MVAAQPHAKRSASRRCLGPCVCARWLTSCYIRPPPDERPWKFLLPVLASGLCRTGGHCLVRRLRPAPRRNHAVPRAGASLGLRQRCNLLGVLLRCPFVAGAWVGRWRLEAVRHRRPWSACLVHRRRQARVLRDLPAHPGGHVLFCSVALWRNCGAGRVADGCVLVRTWSVLPTSR